MSSQIIETNPTAGTATTQSVRENFGAAKKEINDLQKMSTMFSRTDDSSSGSAYTTSFTDQLETNALVDGARITVEIHTISTSTTPTLTVTAGGTDTGAKTIVRQDGSPLEVGDLKAGQYCDLIYDATATKWVWLNSQQDNLFKTVLGIVYPIGHILTTVKSGNPGDAGYFHAGLEFGTWVAFAKGRTIVGLDSGYTPSAATASADDVIQLTFTDSEGESGQLHPFGVGDTITTSGFTTSQANVTNGTVTEATANTIKYASSSSISSGATVTIGSGKVVNTAMDVAFEAGGASTLTKDMLPGHDHLIAKNATSSSNRLTASDQTLAVVRPAHLGLLNENFEYDLGAASSGRADSGQTSDTGSGGSNNNLQPYITTFIWKRTN